MGNESAKFLNGFPLGWFMNPVEGWVSTLSHKTGHGLIGCNHEFFDHLVGKISLGPDDLLGFSLKV
jgi:hypothetical protein